MALTEEDVRIAYAASKITTGNNRSNSGRVALWLEASVDDVNQIIDQYSLPIKKTAAISHFSLLIFLRNKYLMTNKAGRKSKMISCPLYYLLLVMEAFFVSIKELLITLFNT